uniref:Gamma-interferon-inducible lysosomal thiol reductase n=1 Tax=Timema shepardi TaxID=629360 RepID=A0A7R9B997_TIMSH|nr:unnamed protein product [Timema shepardi]
MCSPDTTHISCPDGLITNCRPTKRLAISTLKVTVVGSQLLRNKYRISRFVTHATNFAILWFVCVGSPKRADKVKIRVLRVWDRRFCSFRAMETRAESGPARNINRTIGNQCGPRGSAMEEPLEEWETSRLEVVWAESTALQSLSKRVLVLSPQSLDSRPSHVVIVSAGRGPRFPGLLIPGVSSQLTTIHLEPQAGPIAMKTVALLLVSLLTVHSQEKVQVTVFYESHCPYSVEFITQKLYPAYKALTSANMDVDLVPYGFTKYSVDDDGHYQFSCQHGPSECYGNRVQACALAELSDNLDLQVEFVNCAMSSSNSSTSGPLVMCLQARSKLHRTITHLCSSVPPSSVKATLSYNIPLFQCASKLGQSYTKL